MKDMKDTGMEDTKDIGDTRMGGNTGTRGGMRMGTTRMGNMRMRRDTRMKEHQNGENQDEEEHQDGGGTSR